MGASHHGKSSGLSKRMVPTLQEKENFPSYVIKTRRDLTLSYCVPQEIVFQDVQRFLQLPESKTIRLCIYTLRQRPVLLSAIIS